MARGVNKVIIVGNLGQDPESRSFPDGGSVCNVSVATSESWKDKQTGQQQERTEWHRIVFRNRLAEIAQQYLRKGSKVYIEGSLRTRKWTNQQGQDQYSTEIQANQMQMLDSRNEGMSAPGGQYQSAAPQANTGYQQAPQQAPQSQQQPYSPPPQQHAPAQPMAQPSAMPQAQPMAPQSAPQPAPANNFDDFDDDIPF